MTNEYAQMLQDMARPGFQLIMQRLNDYADALQSDYDRIDFITEPGKAMHTQITRDVIKNGIPKILEKIMNEDKPEVRWTFFGWLRRVRGESE